MKKIKIEPKPKKAPAKEILFIRSVARETQKKFRLAAKDKNMTAAELFQLMVDSLE